MTNRQELNNRFKEVFTMLVDRNEVVKSSRGEKSKSAFAENIGTKAHIIDLYLRGSREITYEQAKIMCKKYNISELYMLQGIGSAFPDVTETFDYIQKQPGTKRTNKNTDGNILFSNIDAFASSAISLDVYEETERFRIPGLIGEHVAFNVHGNSMTPTISDGDLVICRQVEDINRIRENDIYAVVTNGAVMIKRLQKVYNDTGKWTQLKLISDNYIEHDPFILELREIRKVLEVTKRITGL